MSQIKCPMCQSKVDVSSEPAARSVVCPACGENFRPDKVVAKAAPAEAPEPNRYAVLPYNSGLGGGGRVSGLIATMFFGFITTLFLTAVIYIIWNLFWLVMIFSMIHGGVIGLCVGGIGRITRARFPLLLGLIGAGFALMSVWGIHFLDYTLYAPDPNIPNARKVDGFWDYMDMRATEGVQIGDTANGKQASNLGYTGSIIYWLVELLITVVVSAAAAMVLVAEPFCEQCRDWKKKERLGTFWLDMTVATEAAAAGCPAEMISDDDGGDKVTIEIFCCPHCDSEEMEVRVAGVRPLGGNKVQTKTVTVTYPAAAQADFEKVARACKKQKREAK